MQTQKIFDMKKVLLALLFCSCCLAGMAQNKFKLSGITSLTNYGIDYTQAKVYGGKDTGHQYWITYQDINELFIAKPNMYSIEKRLGIPVDAVSLQAVNEANKNINPDHILTRDANYMPTEGQIIEAIRNLPILSQEEKYGIVML